MPSASNTSAAPKFRPRLKSSMSATAVSTSSPTTLGPGLRHLRGAWRDVECRRLEARLREERRRPAETGADVEDMSPHRHAELAEGVPR